MVTVAVTFRIKSLMISVRKSILKGFLLISVDVIITVYHVAMFRKQKNYTELILQDSLCVKSLCIFSGTESHEFYY